MIDIKSLTLEELQAELKKWDSHHSEQVRYLSGFMKE